MEDSLPEIISIPEGIQIFMNYNPEKDIASLDAWIKCRDVKLFFYKRILPLLPKEEKYI